MEVGPRFVPRLCQGLKSQREGDFHVLLHPTEPRWVLVNDGGLEVVRLCDGKRTLEEIRDLLCRRHGGDPRVVSEDLRGCLESLRSAGFFESQEGGSPLTGAQKTRGVLLHATRRCNLRCRHCYIEGPEDRSEEMNTSEIKMLVDELFHVGGSSVIVSGGEPLVREDILEILDYASRRLRVVLSTNGTLIDGNCARTLAGLNLEGIHISVDGSTSEVHDRLRGKGTFDLVRQGVAALQKEGLGEKLCLVCCVNKTNVGCAREMIRLAEDWDIPSLRYIPVRRGGRAVSAWKDIGLETEDLAHFYDALYEDLLGERRAVKVVSGLRGFSPMVKPSDVDGDWCCPVGDRLVVDASGEIYPCPCLVGRDDAQIGSITGDGGQSLARAFDSSSLRERVESYKQRLEKIEECRQCVWKNFCRGACTGSVILEKGTIWATDGLCELRRDLYRRVILEAAARKHRATLA